MKKLTTSMLTALAMLGLTLPAFADAALPPGYRIREALHNVLIPIIIAVVILVIVILVKVLKSKGKRS